MSVLVAQADAMALPLRDESVHAIVCDPPYGLGFMGKGWDTFSPDYIARETSARGRQKPIEGRRSAREGAAWSAGRYDRSLNANQQFERWTEGWAREALRVLKPGGWLLTCGGSRTFHRMMCGIEDAGFEIRDTVDGELTVLRWLYGSGFPKSRDQGKDTDEILARTYAEDRFLHDGFPEFEGWGTALKPAWEPIVMARKPLAGTVAANVLAHGTGALNIDATRIGDADTRRVKSGGSNDFPHEDDAWKPKSVEAGSAHGRWPANVVLDEEAAAALDAQTGALTSGLFLPQHLDHGKAAGTFGAMSGREREAPTYGDSGGPSRFFYTAKASRSEREAGLESMEPVRRSDGREKDIENPRLRTSSRRNDHPTVKPIDLMTWLLRLVTPPGGLVLDPFVGSGSTGVAAKIDGINFVGFDLDAHYLEIARRRIAHAVTAVQGSLL